MKGRLWAAGLAAALVTLTACGSNSSSMSGSGGGTGGSGSKIKLESTSIGQVLANSAGRTLYWFAKDTPTTSNCNAACVTFWPPVKGPAAAAPGTALPGHLGTITRSDGTIQATYDGHPLYTYTGDSATGQTTGNRLPAAGGLWFAMSPSGAELGKGGGGSTSSPSPKSSSSGRGGGGYGGYG